ncbi:hypothetical protein ACN28S_47700 [Cystobacter fuscus]
MVAGTPGRAFYPPSHVAYAIGYALSVMALFVGLLADSVPWLAMGARLAASLTVLVIDHAVGQKTPSTGREDAEGLAPPSGAVPRRSSSSRCWPCSPCSRASSSARPAE